MQEEIQQVEAIYNSIVQFFVNYSFQLVGALIVFLIGMFVASKVSAATLRLCEKKSLDITLSRFIASFVKIVILVGVAIIALGKIGISVTPFVAAIGAISLGAGLAVPYLVVAAFPRLVQRLPRPGRWMIVLKVSSPDELGDLMDAAAYETYLGSLD